MKLYLADEEKLNTFDLPQKVGESFLFSYIPNFTNIEVFFNIFSTDNSWYLRNNDDITINSSEGITKLESYKNYEIKIKGIVNPFYLFTYETYNNNYQDILIDNLNSFTIGSDNSDSIKVNNNMISAKNLTITKENEIFYIEVLSDSKINLYVNKRRIQNKTMISNGDTISKENSITI